MLKAKVMRYGAIGIATVALGSGIAVANTATITNTGPSSNNQVLVNNTQNSNVVNTPNGAVVNNNAQGATSGTANVSGNTTGGSASSGGATNSSTSSTSVTAVSTPIAPMVFSSNNNGTISTTGPSSTNIATFNNDQTQTVVNAPTVNVVNTNSQNSNTGTANVSGNTTGGSATTGGATNTSSSSTTVVF